MPSTIDWDTFISDLGEIEVIRDRPQVEKLSKDYYHFSPVLQAKLADKCADLVVRPTSEAEVLTVAKACVEGQNSPNRARGGHG
jgi:FAD/FMN-containing dehydrogenase